MTSSIDQLDDSPERLTGGAWLPTGPNRTLRWVPGATPAAWQDTSATACGSRRGYDRHKKNGTTPCGPCTESWRDYFRDRAQAKADAA